MFSASRWFIEGEKRSQNTDTRRRKACTKIDCAHRCGSTNAEPEAKQRSDRVRLNATNKQNQRARPLSVIQRGTRFAPLRFAPGSALRSLRSAPALPSLSAPLYQAVFVETPEETYLLIFEAKVLGLETTIAHVNLLYAENNAHGAWSAVQ